MLCLLVSTSAFADKYSESEVGALIKKVEGKLDAISDSDSIKMGREISRIEIYIKNAKRLLDDNDRDEAWYEIGKADAYFMLLNAKKKFFAADNELKNTEKKLKAVKDK